MNYYNQIKEELLNNEVYKKIKDYSIKLTWSHVRELKIRIKNKEYERLDNKTQEELITKEKINIEDFIKNPILIKM